MPAFAALADDTRMQIVETLAADDRTVNELVALFPISQPAISRHLRVLREAGVVTATDEGRQRIYRLNPTAITEVGHWAARLHETWAERFDALGDHLDALKEQRK